MNTSIRNLKANLSGMIRRVQSGETVTVHVRSRPVARIVPLARRDDPESLARIPGLRWQGGKPRGLVNAERLPRGILLSRWVAEDRG
jgi:prevent-host-death family protein